jgi:hypothetical protein
MLRFTFTPEDIEKNLPTYYLLYKMLFCEDDSRARKQKYKKRSNRYSKHI